MTQDTSLVSKTQLIYTSSMYEGQKSGGKAAIITSVLEPRGADNRWPTYFMYYHRV